MQTGTKISVAAHTVLVGWALFGAVFDSEPLPFTVQEVSMISAQEFAALSSQTAAPVVSPEPAALVQPEPTPETPEVDSQSDPEPERVAPEATSQSDPESVPDTPEAELPDPETSDAPDAPVTPEPETTETALVTTPRPKPRQTDRVAPIPVAQPLPDTIPDEVAQPEVAPDEGAEAPRETQEATAPEAANDRTVTEADQEDSEEVIASAAPSRSVRPPRKRPTRPTRTAQPADPEPAAEARDPVADAIAEAMAGTSSGGAETEAPVPSGPPLNSGEKGAFRVAVQSCWVVDPGSQSAKVTVVIGVQMDQSGKVVDGSLRLISSEGGDESAARAAFDKARRAIMRCEKGGYDLPKDKYAHWRDIELTFNPEGMRIR